MGHGVGGEVHGLDGVGWGDPWVELCIATCSTLFSSGRQSIATSAAARHRAVASHAPARRPKLIATRPVGHSEIAICQQTGCLLLETRFRDTLEAR